MDTIGIVLVVALGALIFGRIFYMWGYDRGSRGEREDLPYGITRR